MVKVIAFVGFKSSGKDTSADFLVENYGFEKFAFADKLKDITATLFSWDRDLLDGRSVESRQWREQIDPWWARQLGMASFTPRLALQLIGTEAMRVGFHDNIWILSVMGELQRRNVQRATLTDCRFPNEIALIKQMGGIVVRIRRGPEPAWYGAAEKANEKYNSSSSSYYQEVMKDTGVHSSEWAWIGHAGIDQVIENNGSFEELYDSLEDIMNS